MPGSAGDCGAAEEDLTEFGIITGGIMRIKSGWFKKMGSLDSQTAMEIQS